MSHRFKGVENMKDIADKVRDKSLKKDYGIDMQHTLHLIKCHDMVGEMIAQVKARGEFDNLEGAGQPLNLDENPFEGDLHMAHKILKDNGFAPYWIELGKEIDALKLKLDKEVDYFQRYTRIVFSEKRSAPALRQYEQKKHDFYTQSQERLVEISKKILDYNLHCPVMHLGRANFDVDEELSRLIKDIESLIPN